MVIKEEELANKSILPNLYKAIAYYPQGNWADALSKGQIFSKIWLIQEASKVLKDREFECVYCVGGWYGLLGALWLEKQPIRSTGKFRSFDIDPSCENIADQINKQFIMEGWVFKAITADMLAINYSHHSYELVNSKGQVITMHDEPDLVINTSCEHLEKFEEWMGRLPKGIHVILQSSDYRGIKEHVNCVDSLEAFEKQAGLEKVLFSGELHTAKYKRFMLIGVK